MSNTHHPTPWIRESETSTEIYSAIIPGIKAPARYLVAKCYKLETAERIVACVNALAPFSTEEIKDRTISLEQMANEIAALKNRVVEYDKLVEKLHKHAIVNSENYTDTSLYKQADDKLKEFENQ